MPIVIHHSWLGRSETFLCQCSPPSSHESLKKYSSATCTCPWDKSHSILASNGLKIADRRHYLYCTTHSYPLNSILEFPLWIGRTLWRDINCQIRPYKSQALGHSWIERFWVFTFVYATCPTSPETPKCGNTYGMQIYTQKPNRDQSEILYSTLAYRLTHLAVRHALW